MKLHIDESVKPTAQPHRRIPFHMRKKVKNRLNNQSGRLHVAPSDCCAPSKSREPYNMSPLLDGPSWMEVSVDFKVLSNSAYLSVITDDYLRYPIVEIIASTAAKVVIPDTVIDKVIAEFGVGADTHVIIPVYQGTSYIYFYGESRLRMDSIHRTHLHLSS